MCSVPCSAIAFGYCAGLLAAMSVVLWWLALVCCPKTATRVFLAHLALAQCLRGSRARAKEDTEVIDVDPFAKYAQAKQRRQPSRRTTAAERKKVHAHH